LRTALPPCRRGWGHSWPRGRTQTWSCAPWRASGTAGKVLCTGKTWAWSRGRITRVDFMNQWLPKFMAKKVVPCWFAKQWFAKRRFAKNPNTVFRWKPGSSNDVYST
jgi:hypothetical protein